MASAFPASAACGEAPALTRLAYLGSPEAAVPPLRALVSAGHDVAVVVTQPDRRRGRGSALTPSPVGVAAAELGLPVVHRVADVLDHRVELGVVVAFGKLIRPAVLDVVPMVNLHFSLLPRWRGAAPVERALLAGDAETGVCLMRLDEGLDTGPVIDCLRTPIDSDEGVDELRDRLVRLGTDLLVDRLSRPLPPGSPQLGEPTYAAKLDPAEMRVDWARPAVEVQRLVRLGRAWTTVGERRLRILGVEVATPEAGEVAAAPGELVGDLVGCAPGAVRLLRVQPEGRPPVEAAAWLRGARLPDGSVLGSS